MLRRSGAAVTAVRKIYDANLLLTVGSYDVAIVDGLLPDGSGMDFIKKRRQAGDYTPMVFCSSFWKDFATHTALKNTWGVHAVISKPVTQEQELLQAVSDFFA